MSQGLGSQNTREVVVRIGARKWRGYVQVWLVVTDVEDWVYIYITPARSRRPPGLHMIVTSVCNPMIISIIVISIGLLLILFVR